MFWFDRNPTIYGWEGSMQQSLITLLSVIYCIGVEKLLGSTFPSMSTTELIKSDRHIKIAIVNWTWVPGSKSPVHSLNKPDK